MSGWGLSTAAQTLLQQVQSIFGADKVTVTSGARSSGSNASIKGASKTSQHLSGDAFDFVVKGYSPDQVQTILSNSGLSFGQSIQEYGAGMGPRNHLGVGTKGQLLTGNDGKYTTTGYAAAVGAPTMGGGRSYLNSVLGDTIGNTMSDGLAGFGSILAVPGEALFGGSSLSGWFQRISFGLLALLLIGVALFMLAGKPAMNVAGKIPPIPV